MMYNQKSSRSRMMRPLALLPALAAALWITQLPAIASVKEAAEKIDVASDSKITEFSADSQMADFQVKESDATNDVAQTTGVVASVKAAAPAETAAVAADDKTTDEPSKAAEQMPEYPGGMKAMMNYVIENIHRPAGTDDISGNVVLQFVVEKDGSIGDTKVIRSLDPRLDAEAIRVVKSFPKWNPGTKDGVPVAVWYSIPIRFKSMKDVVVSSDKSAATSSKDADPKVITVIDGDKELNVISTSSRVPENMTIYVNGQLYDGNLNDISPSDIESITINKTAADSPQMLITLKKK